MARAEDDNDASPLKDTIDREATLLERVSHAIASLDDLVSDAMERTGVPGVAVAVVFRDELAYINGFGVKSTDGNEPIGPDTVFQMASLSKPVASTVVAGLVGDGFVQWNTPIQDIMPDFHLFDPCASRSVTLADLFAHRSGLPDHAGDLLEDIGYDRDFVLHKLRHFRPQYDFRAGYAYTNFGLTAAAEAAARSAGMTWEEASDVRLYQRIGMSSTSSRFDDFIAASDRASGHVRDGDSWVPAFVREPDAQSPAGGVSSTARDMAAWMRLHLRNGSFDGDDVIDPEALAETHRPQSMSGPPANPFTDLPGFYGLGWNVNYDRAGRLHLGHSGAFALGAATAVRLTPAWDVGICVLTNALPIGLPEAISLSFVDLIERGEVQVDYIEVFAPIFEGVLAPTYPVVEGDRPADGGSPLGADAYTGVYGNDPYGDVEIRSDGNSLELVMGPDGMNFPLTHWARDTFVFTPAGENAAGRSAVTFMVGADGRATAVTIGYFDGNGQGQFMRRDTNT